MDKEKILAAAQNNKNRGMEYESKTTIHSSFLGMLVATLVGLGLFLLEYFANGVANLELIAVGFTMIGVQALCEGKKLEKGYLIVIGVVEIVIALLFIMAFVKRVVMQ